ncbi:MAG TPA: metalloregulator ArsR/SmtB family transcription factor [Planctomycetota bacterium]|nr:metalloregulator ArsR/SmtB family transcription factor [Planctomycetota bacterium]
MSRSSTAVAPARGAAPLFAALGDEVRLRLVARLAANGPESITALCATHAITRQAISKHLTVLARAGLARARRRGRERIWQLEPRRLSEASEYLDQISRQWDIALDRLKTFLDGEAK